MAREIEMLNFGQGRIHTEAAMHEDVHLDSLLERREMSSNASTPADAVKAEFVDVNIRPRFQIVDRSSEIFELLDTGIAMRHCPSRDANTSTSFVSALVYGIHHSSPTSHQEREDSDVYHIFGICLRLYIETRKENDRLEWWFGVLGKEQVGDHGHR